MPKTKRVKTSGGMTQGAGRPGGKRGHAPKMPKVRRASTSTLTRTSGMKGG